MDTTTTTQRIDDLLRRAEGGPGQVRLWLLHARNIGGELGDALRAAIESAGGVKPALELLDAAAKDAPRA